MLQRCVERTAMQSFETVDEKYSSSDGSTILFTDEKDIYSAHTKNHKELSVYNCSNQEERCCIKMP